MANARITSGSGDGAVKSYTRVDGKITVRGLKVNGVRVDVRLEAPGGATDEGETHGNVVFMKEITVPAPGLYSLVVETGDPGGARGKDLRQQIQVQ